jgi:hypothetical protein
VFPLWSMAVCRRDLGHWCIPAASIGWWWCWCVLSCSGGQSRRWQEAILLRSPSISSTCNLSSALLKKGVSFLLLWVARSIAGDWRRCSLECIRGALPSVDLLHGHRETTPSLLVDVGPFWPATVGDDYPSWWYANLEAPPHQPSRLLTPHSKWYHRRRCGARLCCNVKKRWIRS